MVEESVLCRPRRVPAAKRKDRNGTEANEENGNPQIAQISQSWRAELHESPFVSRGTDDSRKDAKTPRLGKLSTGNWEPALRASPCNLCNESLI
jgi:hypothetical protein